jgi:hypothetical protein
VSSSSSEGQQLAWTYFKDNFERLKAKLAKANPSLMHAVIVYSARGFVGKGTAAVWCHNVWWGYSNSYVSVV